MSIVQLFNRERRNYERFDELNRDYLKETIRSILYFILFGSITSFFSALAVALIIWYGGGRVLIGALSLGALVAYLQYVDRFFLPIRDLAEKYNILQSAMASSERIFKVIDEPIMIQDAPEPRNFDEVKGEIEFRDVWFAYNPDEWVLKGISLKIRPGERVALVGATGAGKTSIISLISRFYDVQKGAILIDGIDIREVRQKELRRHVGTVLQDPFIFSGTVASNIRLHDEDISDERLHEAAEYVNAAHFIEQLPHGYAEEVRERGAGLSVGQKQLLAFARAIAFNPEILLILDEATSSVDTETEVLIQDALNKLMTNRTSIINHRPSALDNSQCRSHHRAAQGAHRGGRLSRGAAQPPGCVSQAVRIPVRAIRSGICLRQQQAFFVDAPDHVLDLRFLKCHIAQAIAGSQPCDEFMGGDGIAMKTEGYLRVVCADHSYAFG